MTDRPQRVLIAGACIPLALWAALAVQAEVTCLPRAELAAELEAQYGELPTAAGIDNAGRLIEIFASPDGGTWTIVSTSPQARISCIVTSGEGWVALTPAKHGPAL